VECVVRGGLSQACLPWLRLYMDIRVSLLAPEYAKTTMKVIDVEVTGTWA
jgi:hypothetical protein